MTECSTPVSFPPDVPQARRDVERPGLAERQLDGATVELWLADMARIPTDVISSYASQLNGEELQRCQRLHREVDRRRAIVTRVMLRWVLSHYRALPLQAWQFSLGEHGKPGLAGMASDLRFNLSHSGDMIVCAVCSHGEIGVDVEAMDQRRDFASLAERFFSKLEYAALCELPESRQRLRFYQLWALKESRIKATGEGMALALDSFSFGWNESGQVCLQQETNKPDGNWQHWWLDQLPGYSLALSWLRASAQQGNLRVARCTPLVSCGKWSSPAA